ncbi:MAG: hypothetical protein KC646_08855 [Candidatus Cloacimonetes bacterium]|nr:hypothetical protein [Candidatus Cloacimonadota bacterium]
MEDNTQDLQKQLSDAKEQLNWLRQNFNEEINVLIKENRELKEQLKSNIKTQETPVVNTNDIPDVSLESPVLQPESNESKIEITFQEPSQEDSVLPQAPPEISSLRWVLEWMICKFKDWFIRLPCTIGLLVYHIFAIQYHKHLCNKR